MRLQRRHCWLTHSCRCPLASQHYLNFGQNGHHGHDDAENEVEADEDLVLRAVIGPGVKDVEEHNSSESQDVVDNGDKQQSCKANIGKEIRNFFLFRLKRKQLFHHDMSLFCGQIQAVR